MTRCTQCFSELLELAVFCPRCGRPKEPALDRLLNRSLGGRYYLYRRLGEGGLATVFAAIDTQSDRIVAVKVSDPRQLVQRELNEAFDVAQARRYWNEMLERMQREAIALAAIDHPHIVRLLETDLITPELRYVVMEFLRGRTLRAELEARGRLGVSETMRIIEAISSGLSVVHARGIIHRDLNPRNIFLCSAEESEAEREQPSEQLFSASQPLSPSAFCKVKIIDFGIAKIPPLPGEAPLTQHSVMSGTVAYASPEQCQNEVLDHRSDIYSLGVMIYEMVTGERPFRGRTAAEIAWKQIQAEPLSPRALVPDLPAALEAAILRALAKSPAARQQSVEELMADLRAVGRRLVVPLKGGQEALASAPSPISFSTDEVALADAELPGQREESEEALRLRLIRKRRRRSALVAAGVAVVLAVSGWLLAQHGLSSHRRAKAPLAFDPVSSPGASPAGQSGEGVQFNPARAADALEMAARLSTLEPDLGSSPALPGEKPSSSTASKEANNSSLLPPVLPQARPQSTPVITAMTQPPTDQTASGVEPQPTPPAATRPRESDQTPSVSRQPETPGPQHEQEERNDSRDEGWSSTPRPEPPSEPDDRPSVRTVLGPKIITWKGIVSLEREVVLELPGVPGTVEIPRNYSKRVGVIEPPGPDNNWRRVVLRVFGRGEVFFVIRWWPSAPNVARFTVRR